jgi:hypothetical protein
MKKSILSLFLLLSVIANGYAAGADPNDPYKGESGFLRQVVYLDLPGTHVPILPNDYHTWFIIGGLICLSLITLFTVIKAKTLVFSLNKKYGLQN